MTIMTTTDPTVEDPASGLVLPPPAAAATLRPVELAESLVEQARPEGVELVGPGGLLGDLTKRVLEASLEAETDDHLGYPKHDPAGSDGGGTLDGMRGIALICFARRVGMGTSNLPVRRRGLR